MARHFRAQAVEIIEQFLSSAEVEVVRLDWELFHDAFALFSSYEDKEWGLMDCVSFVVMRRLGIDEALTFDLHFVQAGFLAAMRQAD